MQHEVLILAALRSHQSNARAKREYTKQGVAGLMASIQEHGLLQPLVVTPVRAEDGGGYTILAGHRRHAALKALGIEEAPCVVLDADDREALAVLLTENASHRPVDPLKEAEAVQNLVEGFAGETHPHDRAAAVLGKSVAWVRGRLRLTTLSPAWRKAHADGESPVHEWPVGHLELVAALPEAVQDQVLEHYQGAFHDAVPLLSELRRTVADHTQTLDHVPWDPDAPDVAEGTPPCTACPRRESAQGGLFGGILRTKGDRCLDVTCFTRKRAAVVLSRIEEARAKHGDALAVEVGWGSPDVPLPEGIRIDARTDQPFRRTGFRHPLPAWALQHRDTLVLAAITLAMNWVVAGRPTPKGVVPLGMYEEWSHTMGGITKKVLRTAYLGTVKRATGVPQEKRDRLTFHGLRHTAASLMVQAGVPFLEVMAIFGWRTVAMVQRYAHLAPGAQRRAIVSLDEAFDAASKRGTAGSATEAAEVREGPTGREASQRPAG